MADSGIDMGALDEPEPEVTLVEETPAEPTPAAESPAEDAQA